VFPPSQEGYVAAQRRTEERLESDRFKPGTLIHEASEENIDRTVAFVTKITEAMIFRDKAHFTRKAEALVEAFAKRIGRI
jgi:hypothetical protein